MTMSIINILYANSSQHDRTKETYAWKWHVAAIWREASYTWHRNGGRHRIDSIQVLTRGRYLAGDLLTRPHKEDISRETSYPSHAHRNQWVTTRPISDDTSEPHPSTITVSITHHHPSPSPSPSPCSPPKDLLLYHDNHPVTTSLSALQNHGQSLITSSRSCAFQHCAIVYIGVFNFVDEPRCKSSPRRTVSDNCVLPSSCVRPRRGMRQQLRTLWSWWTGRAIGR